MERFLGKEIEGERGREREVCVCERERERARERGRKSERGRGRERGRKRERERERERGRKSEKEREEMHTVIPMYICAFVSCATSYADRISENVTPPITYTRKRPVEDANAPPVVSCRIQRNQ